MTLMIPRRKPRFYKGQLNDIIRFIFSADATQGLYIELFEKKVAEYIGTKFAIATNSGRGALALLLDAYQLNRGDEIIVPAYTLKDLIKLIKNKGFSPKVVDIEQDSLNIDSELIGAQIGPKTKAILATHIFGLSCNLEKIIHIARKYNLKVIEDCAHALGGEYKGKKVGSWGDSAIFSLEFSKNINTFGGGLVTTDDEKVACAVRARVIELPFSRRALLKKIIYCYLEHFLTVSPFFQIVLLPFCFRKTSTLFRKAYLALYDNSRASAFRYTNCQAFMGLKQLERLDRLSAQRIRLAEQLHVLFSNNPHIRLQTSLSKNGRLYYQYVIRTPKEYDLYMFRRQLLLKGVDCGILSEITDNCGTILNKKCPNAEDVYRTAVQLPLYDDMSVSQIEKISKTVNLILGS